jgi:hypothetical protein
MRECGADETGIERFISELREGQSVSAALTACQAPTTVVRFVESTFDTIESGSTARILGAFTLGREDVIPDMFRHLVHDLDGRSMGRFTRLRDYLDRHIRLDGETHGPHAAPLLEAHCGENALEWQAALIGARQALVERYVLWDGILGATREASAAL